MKLASSGTFWTSQTMCVFLRSTYSFLWTIPNQALPLRIPRFWPMYLWPLMINSKLPTCYCRKQPHDDVSRSTWNYTINGVVNDDLWVQVHVTILTDDVSKITHYVNVEKYFSILNCRTHADFRGRETFYFSQIW